MLKFLNKKRNTGQSTLEYAILIIIIIGALLTIQMYIKRGVQGRLKQATDDVGDQFDPGNTNYNRVTTTTGTTRDTFVSGETTSQLTKAETTASETNAELINREQTYWGQ